jgi:hypothetical protein
MGNIFRTIADVVAVYLNLLPFQTESKTSENVQIEKATDARPEWRADLTFQVTRPILSGIVGQDKSADGKVLALEAHTGKVAQLGLFLGNALPLMLSEDYARLLTAYQADFEDARISRTPEEIAKDTRSEEEILNDYMQRACDSASEALIIYAAARFFCGRAEQTARAGAIAAKRKASATAASVAANASAFDTEQADAMFSALLAKIKADNPDLSEEQILARFRK